MKGMISVRRRRAARWTGERDHGQGRGNEGGGGYSSYGDGRGVQNGRVSSCERPSTGFMRRRGPSVTVAAAGSVSIGAGAGPADAAGSVDITDTRRV